MTKRKIVALFLVGWLTLSAPVSALAQSGVDATGVATGAPTCTGAGCGQGANQGAGQGENQGGPSREDLGGTVDEDGNTILPEGVEDTRQGASNGTSAVNSGTGSGSTNNIGTDVNSSDTTNIDNTAVDRTDVSATGTTGRNSANRNTGTGDITSGSSSIGVTQVRRDNTAVVNGTAGLSTSGHNGSHEGDLTLGFGAGTANLNGANGGSVRAVNEVTGSDSSNSIDVRTRTEELVEVQNDGRIDNILDLAAITGQNSANRNTGDGRIASGDANVAATLINLLNTTVINGDLWITVADIFGDLNGNILVPQLAALAAAARASTTIDAGNDTTGSNSDNTIDVAIRETETTEIRNDADVNTVINAAAITGQNTARANTGGAEIVTGDASVTGSNITVANMTVEGGNWGLFVVNALNGWLGFLVGDNGQVRALSQDETVREIEAHNFQTGSDSDNTITITDEHTETTTVENNAVINNDITARAITGQNEASENTGQGNIQTGNASVQATAVNIANTTVRNGSLFIAVVNIFGDWMGDLFYSGTSLAQAAAGQAGNQVDITAGNTDTGAGSTNEVNVEIDRTHETVIENEADLTFALNAEVDTGNNRASRNTLGAAIDTGRGFLAQHSLAAANTTAIAGPGGLRVDITGTNGGTGFDSRNTIRADINDSRVISINNAANVSTLLGSAGSPALVNTGGNEANENTGGARIDTGSAAADVAVRNMVNRVVLALAGEGVEVDAEFINVLTGALSDNENTLTVLYSTLAEVTNTAVIDTILNLMLNTGRNVASDNTGGVSVTTGEGCFNGEVSNSVNAVDVGAAASLNLDNTAEVNNQANIAAITGENLQQNNTGGLGGAGSPDPCVKLAAAPEPTAAPTPAPVPSEGDGGQDVGGGEPEGEDQVVEEREKEKKPSVAAAVSQKKPRVPRIAAGRLLLKRFPVAGGENIARWLPGDNRLPWLPYAFLGMGVVGAAYYFDRRARGIA